MDDSRDGVRGDEEEEEAVEGEPGQEVAAPPVVQPAQREQVHHRRQRREHRHSQACDRQIRDNVTYTTMEQFSLLDIWIHSCNLSLKLLLHTKEVTVSKKKIGP